MTDPSQRPPEPHHYADDQDPQAQRSRFELWAIVAIVVVVLVGAFVWRAVTGTPPGPQAGVRPTDPPSAAATAAAGAGVPAHGVGAPTPRPAAP